MAKLYDYTHFDIENPGYGVTGEAAMDVNQARVNMVAYKRASMATRDYAKKKKINPIKATKALSETTRNMVDTNYGMDRGQAKSSITRGLNGLVDRFSGNRSGRGSASIGREMTNKGMAIGTFGQHLGSELGYGNSYVSRPKLPKGTGVKGVKTAASIIGKLK